MSSLLAVLAAGFWLVFEGPWSFSRDGWVGAGLGLLIAIFVLGVALYVPASKKLVQLGESGASEAALEEQIRFIRRLSWIDIILLAAAIFVMTVKPF
jgi:uncharacterized membrane protein